MMAMLRAEFVKAQEYVKKRDTAEADKKPDRNLGLEVLARVLNRELPLMITANRAQDITSTLRLAKEFNIKLILDGAAESYLLIDEIKSARDIVEQTVAEFFAITQRLGALAGARSFG